MRPVKAEAVGCAGALTSRTPDLEDLLPFLLEVCVSRLRALVHSTLRNSLAWRPPPPSCLEPCLPAVGVSTCLVVDRTPLLLSSLGLCRCAVFLGLLAAACLLVPSHWPFFYF